MALPEGSRHYLLAPVVRGRKGEYRKELAEWQKAGFTRVRIDGAFYAIEDAPALDKKYKHDIEVVVDRIVVREGIEPRLADSFETALKLAEGLAYLDPADPSHDAPGAEAPASRSARASRRVQARLRARPAASSSPRSSPAPSAASPSPRSSRASSRSTRRRAPAPPATASARSSCSTRTSSSPTTPLDQEGRGRPLGQVQPAQPLLHAGAAPASPAPTISSSTRRGSDLPEEAQRVILHGTGGKPVTLRFIDGRRSYEVKKPFEGVIGNLNRRMLQTESAWMREELSRYQASRPCEVCHGARLKPEALAVKIAGEDISMSTRRSVADAYAWFGSAPRKAHPAPSSEIAKAILKEINERLGFLHNVGLDYLHLDRTSGTL